MKMKTKTEQLVTAAMLAAIAYVIVALIRIPIVLFLKYEPKDVVITIGGFLYGPLTSFAISGVVSLIEMVTVSDTGIIGCIMNLLSTCSFACTAAFIYKKRHTLRGAVEGMIAGTIVMTVIMLLWNYLITPLYMGYPRDAVAKMLLPAFLPFNLLKGGLNTAILFLIYKPVVSALRKAGLVESSQNTDTTKGRNIGIALVSSLLLCTCILYALSLRGII